MILRRLQQSLILVAAMICAVILVAISACDSVRSLPAMPAAADAASTSSATDTVIPLSPTENETVSLQEFKAGYPPGWFMDPTIAAGVTAIAERNNRYLTAIALTPTTADPPYTPAPTRTLGVGIIKDVGCWRSTGDGKPFYASCGDAYVNGAWLFLGAGHTGGGLNFENPPQQSALLVCPEPLEDHLGGSGCTTYDTPVNVNDIHIDTISGSQVTLLPRDTDNHMSFVFDLTSRQWVATTTPNATSVAGSTATPTTTITALALSPTENATVTYQEIKAGYPPGWFMDPTIAAGVTAIMERTNSTLTAIALTPTTTEVPYTPAPTRTPGVGMIAEIDCLPPVNYGKPQYPNCWEANVNATWLFVGAGFTGELHGYNDNPFRGLIVVSLKPIEKHLRRDSITYDTPVNVGEVRIASIIGSLVTVVPRDPDNHASFVFDLEAREWLSKTIQ